MPAETDMIGHGAALEYYSTTATWTGTTTAPTGGSWVSVGSLLEVAAPERTADDVETTHYGSTGQHREFKAGLADPGALDFTVKYTDGGFDALNGIYRIPRAWRVTYNDGSGHGFNGFLGTLGGEVPMDNLITVTGSIKLSGLVFDIDAT